MKTVTVQISDSDYEDMQNFFASNPLHGGKPLIAVGRLIAVEGMSQTELSSDLDRRVYERAMKAERHVEGASTTLQRCECRNYPDGREVNPFCNLHGGGKQ